MKTQFLIILVAFSVSNIFAQTDSLAFQRDIDSLKEKLLLLENKFETYKQNIDSLQQITANKLDKEIDSFKTYKQNIDSLQQITDTKFNNIEKTSGELDEKIEKTNKTASQNTLYWIIAVLVVPALFVLLVFFLLRKQLFKQKTDLDSNLEKTRKVHEEEVVNLDNKLIEVLETQLKIIIASTEKEADHTLVLKVADEITRIQKNLTQMGEKVRGVKQLTASVKRIQDNFASNDYEIVEMLGKKYDEGMIVIASFIPDENLKEGERIITRIIKPQVNYKGTMIQSAQIEVSQG